MAASSKPASSAAGSEPRARIVREAARLLKDGGVPAVTTRAVAEAAGVQAPAIYRLFGDKEGLIDAVAEYEAARYVSEKAGDEETDDPVADLRASWDRNVRFGLANPALFGLLTDPGRVAGSPVAAAGLGLLRARVHRVAAAGRLRVPEARAVGLIQAAGIGAVSTLLAAGAEDRDDGLADAIFDSVMATILRDPPQAPENHTGAAAITLRASLAHLPTLTEGERALMGELLDRLADA